MHPIIEGRWSPRAFAADVVAPEVLRVLLEAARWAPSHGNTQPARFLVGYRGDDTFGRIFATLRPGNQGWAGAAAVLLVGMVVTADERGSLPNTEYGLGLAVENLALQAVDLGLAAHQMGGFDREAVRAAFAVPEDVRPVVVIAVGRAGDPASLPEDLREREQRPRRRRPLSETVFTGVYGRSAFSAESADEPDHE
ncbi:nitroreductase family protein [Actinosynnema sp. NPDC020468]|uniref:nitroreductase family protein n=1 Tax=Actinosynnema sp. NPDC020468 TaxID=3154488 RepID=UPI0033EDC238